MEVILTLILILGPGAISYAPLEKVVENKGWEGTEAFDVLVAPEDCSLMAKQGWLLVKDEGLLTALVVDCENPKHKGGLRKNSLLLDSNRKDLIGKEAWLILKY